MSAHVLTPALAAAPVVDLPVAQVCQDCNGISAAPNGLCARCGSQSLLALANVLNRAAESTQKEEGK
jgi:hypothetical protein